MMRPISPSHSVSRTPLVRPDLIPMPLAATGRRRSKRANWPAGRKGLVLDPLDDVASVVVERRYENWTPEQIAGWLKSGAERLGAIGHEAIYA